MNVQTIREQLRSLKLPTAAKELEQVLAREGKALQLSWVAELLEREIDARKERSSADRIKRARFPELTTLEGFDWQFNPQIEEEKIKALRSLEFIHQNQINLFLGNPGTGKTHIAIALGVLAAQAGFRVYCTSLKSLAKSIRLAKAKNELDLFFKKMLSVRLWLIDDWAVISLPRDIAEEILDLLDRRKYNSAMILTSHRNIDEWAEMFPDPVLANATIDRIFDRAELFLFQGSSYRLKGKLKISEIDKVEK